MKISEFFLPEKFSVFGGKIFYIFEQVCFRNDKEFLCLVEMHVQPGGP